MKEKSLAAVEEFINGLTVLPLSSCVKVYAKEKVRLRQIGKPINDEFDLLIASPAKTNELILVTDNVKHFKHIQGLRIENWFRKFKLRLFVGKPKSLLS
jgi:tRNA(fMet)-specific endonuclease VapC